MANAKLMTRIAESGLDKELWKLEKQIYKVRDDETIDTNKLIAQRDQLVYDWLKENKKWFKENGYSYTDHFFSLVKIHKVIGSASSNRKHKSRRVFEKLQRMAENARELKMNMYFVTLTWTDDYLSGSYEYRRKLINQFFNQFPMYQCNIDFSPDIDREHYHGVVLTDKPLSKKTKTNEDGSYETEISNLWKGGFANAKKVNLGKKNVEVDFRKMGKYLGKIGYHAIKETEKGLRIVYSTTKHEEKMLQPLREKVRIEKMKELFGENNFDVVEV